MAKYKFEQFNVEIENPTITIDPTQIKVDAVNNTISLSLILETTEAKVYGVEVLDISVENLNYEGEENLMERALQGLEKYKV
ncbi:hypothetical protein D8Z79_025970 (plasmid) [Escherichia fergusonii]|uniref:DUF2283 domain-containing protein n=1 Tax=Lysinibacillus pakistanensis TaxID=759811 RepID=A0ABX6DHB8_9BACI|nr:hypothetical protein [Escherichia fergusonii]QCZ35047.1 hypothetical protein D8Z79_025745 [Escherichia fergusonii]QCZ35090.1 hypothetical protein D8Z79_025970 [Escherichia fergusonii]QGG54102.1 hypothetical protein GDS87_24595 [Lysinibacillus pakistanensis]QGG54158.1 hypothetical protein GDS87_24880 [Lysinibacillus pakistanensis]